MGIGLILFALCGESVRGQSSSMVNELFSHAQPQAQMPWSVEVLPVKLTSFQRLEVNFKVSVPGRAISDDQSPSDFRLFVRITEAKTDETLAQSDDHRMVFDRSRGLIFYPTIFVLPGEYQARILLTDRARGFHNLARKRFRVPQLSRDPMPYAWRDLHRVEFVPPWQGLDSCFRPKLASDLWLPVIPSSPIRFEIVMLVNPQTAGLLSSLRTFLQLDMPAHSMGVTVIDLSQPRTLLRQTSVSGAETFDWPRLREALQGASKTPPQRPLGVYPANAASFVRETLESILFERQAAGTENSLATVLVVIGFGGSFEQGADLTPVSPGEGTVHAYYYQYRIELENVLQGPDSLARLLGRLAPRISHIRSAQDERRAIAETLDRLNRND
jgi:hypothetical protein